MKPVLWKESPSAARADYLSLSEHLRLNGAIGLECLQPAQIDGYLAALGDQTAGLRERLRTDATLRTLAASPLMLSIMVLASLQGNPLPEQSTGTLQGIRDELLRAYVDRAFKRRRKFSRRFEQRTVISCLALLAAHETRQPFGVPDRADSADVVSASRRVLAVCRFLPDALCMVWSLVVWLVTVVAACGLASV